MEGNRARGKGASLARDRPAGLSRCSGKQLCEGRYSCRGKGGEQGGRNVGNSLRWDWVDRFGSGDRKDREWR